jgi:hypothetical protein
MLAWNKTRDTIGVSQLMAATHMPVAELAVLLDRIAPPIRKRQALKSANQPAQKGSNGNSTKHQ